jgi:hypothetical protein
VIIYIIILIGNINLLGVNFGFSGSVSIGSFSGGSLFSWSDTEILWNLPPGEGAFINVIVSVASQTSSATPAYLNYSTPNLISVFPSSGPIVGGLVLTLTGSNFGLNAIVTIGSATCNLQSQSHSQIFCVQPGGQDVRTQPVTVTAASQSSSGSVSFSYFASPTSAPTNLPTASPTSPIIPCYVSVYSGYDCASNDITLLSISNASQCASECDKRYPSCVGFAIGMFE